MTEAMNSVLDYAFNDLDFHRLEADTDPDNAASLALLEKFGFQREGYFRERWFVHGKWHDSVMLGLLRSYYETQPEQKPINGRSHYALAVCQEQTLLVKNAAPGERSAAVCRTRSRLPCPLDSRLSCKQPADLSLKRRLPTHAQYRQ